MSKSYKTNNVEDESDDDDSTSCIELWSREESPQINVPLYYFEKSTIDAETLTMPYITLNQRTTNDDDWGIYSCVWDAGIAITSYLIQNEMKAVNFCKQDSNEILKPKKKLLIDIGSGTGIVGLGYAKYLSLLVPPSSLASRPQYRSHSILTDLKEALPLLDENIALNDLSRSSSGKNSQIYASSMELDWADAELPLDLVNEVKALVFEDCDSQILVTGADVVYKPQLFDILLTTLEKILRIIPDSKKEKVSIVFGNSAIRQYFPDFISLAQQKGFEVKWIAKCFIDNKTHHSNTDGEEKERSGLPQISFIPPESQIISTKKLSPSSMNSCLYKQTVDKHPHSVHIFEFTHMFQQEN